MKELITSDGRKLYHLRAVDNNGRSIDKHLQAHVAVACTFKPNQIDPNKGIHHINHNFLKAGVFGLVDKII